jgi:MoaA/NifB/PqqE/SkfB family radical SAM enzyme
MFCPRPFQQYYVTPDGDVHPCCPKWVAMPIGNVLAAHPIGVWHNWVAQNVRRSIEDGSFRHCTGCKLLPGPEGCVVAESPPEPPSVERIHTLTAAYDTACNLACGSCRSQVAGSSETSLAIQDTLVRSGIFRLVDVLCSSGSGDPLASPLFWKLLDDLPRTKYPHLSLSLQTNGLLLDESRWRRLTDLHGHPVVELLVSVDAATPETYAENRGGRWEVLVENLAFASTLKIPTVQLNFVVQSNNVEEVPGFAVLAKKLGATRVYFSALENWGTYDKKEYLDRAVHLPQHPKHDRLLASLAAVRSTSGPNRPQVILSGLPRGNKT